MKLTFVDKIFPLLYKVDKNDQKREWECWVISNTLYRKYGLMDGKKVKSQRIFLGKNIGKSNETSPQEQAISEGMKEWTKQIDKEYLPLEDDTEGQKLLKKVLDEKNKTGGHNINTSAGAGIKKQKNIKRKIEETFIVENFQAIIPMKAHVWELENENDPKSVKPKVLKYFTDKKEPTSFYGQPKLDGWRAIVSIKNDQIVITSNSGKQYPFFKDLRRDFKKLFDSFTSDFQIDGFDGEIYNTEIYDKDGDYIPEDKRFSTICSICSLSRSEPHELESQIQFHVFDIVDKSGKLNQIERFKILDDIFGRVKCSKSMIVKVQTEIIDSYEKVPEYHDKFAAMGYEGIVLRSFDLLYQPGKRSNHMRKHKNFKDEEFEIVGAECDKGISVEHFTWILKNKNDLIFGAKPKGTREEKFEWYKNRKKYTGKYLTVKFQEYTETGVPRFPIAKNFRSSPGED